MKKNKVIKGELMVLGILFIITFMACKKESSNSKENSTSNFVVKTIDPVVTSTAKEQVQGGNTSKDELSIFNTQNDKTLNDKISGIADVAGDKASQAEEVSGGNLEHSENNGNEREGELDPIQVFLDGVGSVSSPLKSEKVNKTVVESVTAMPAASKVKFNTVNAATLAACFYQEDISQAVYLRMENKSYNETCTIGIDNLQYVRVLHFGFDGEIYIGELVVNRLIARDIVAIFKELFDAGYQIQQMVLIDDYDAEDILSMEANNTSSFNYRVVDGTSKLSKHAYGLAIDINPMYNPYVKTIDGKEVILPENGVEYADRSLENIHYIVKGDVCYEAFIKRGFTWGGNWETSKDYQHFQKLIE